MENIDKKELSSDEQANSAEVEPKEREKADCKQPAMSVKSHHLGTAAYIVIGLLVALLAIYSGYYLGKHSGAAGKYAKLNAVLELVEQLYVDEVSTDSIQEKVIPLVLEQLDPHSSYLSAQLQQQETERLEGSFSGIGVQFNTITDTVVVVQVIAGGPSARAGVKAGDRILGVSGYDLTKPPLDSDSIRNHLKGLEGSVADLSILRNGKPMHLKVTRGHVPINSIESQYEIAQGILYAKLNGWGRTTHKEFLATVSPMLTKGRLKGIVLDLRGNGGGYMEAAVRMSNEFLQRGQSILYVEGKAYPKETVLADGTGLLKRVPLIVMVDEFSASSSEIFAGAMQDQDRAVIVGRRTFGKGFVQQPYDFPDGSEVRLTIARYFTPSGRCIQKPYEPGNLYDYSMEVQNRYAQDEWDKEIDPPQDPRLLYRTQGGRVVYGGGGISPDVFIPRDTTGFTSYYFRLVNQGVLHKFSFIYADRYRAKLSQYKTAEELVGYLNTQGLLYQVGNFAHREGIALRPNALHSSADLILNQTYALIAEHILSRKAMWMIFNERDNGILRCVEMIEKEQAFPLSLNGREDRKEEVEKTPSKE